MSDFGEKALLIGTPFSVFIISVFVATILTQSYSNPLDEDWITRQFLIGMFMFVGLTIIPRLLHLQLFFSGAIPSCTINLCHHPPTLQTTHEFNIRSYSICSGCFGTLLSILLAEFIFLGYFLNPNLFSLDLATIYLLMGLILIVISYSRYLIFIKPSVRLIQHTSLLVGIVLALIACDLLFKSSLFMIALLPSWLLFLITRIKLGELDHREY
ncbi:MAG: hypothetical protein ACXADY_15855 [Candidatus Hodarchaeales archaeon]